MSELLKVKLTEGRRVKDPHTGAVLEEKRIYSVPKIQYWFKKIQDKDVEQVFEEQKIEDVKAEKPSKKKEKKGEQ